MKAASEASDVAAHISKALTSYILQREICSCDMHVGAAAANCPPEFSFSRTPANQQEYRVFTHPEQKISILVMLRLCAVTEVSNSSCSGASWKNVGSAIHAVAEACVAALVHASDWGMTNVEVESDCQELIKAVRGTEADLAREGVLFKEI